MNDSLIDATEYEHVVRLLQRTADEQRFDLSYRSRLLHHLVASSTTLIPAMLELIEDERANLSTRAKAVHLLGKVGFIERQVHERLAALREHQELGKIVSAALEKAQMLHDQWLLLEDPDPHVRGTAAWKLWSRGVERGEVDRVFMECALGGEIGYQDEISLMCLGAIAPRNSEALKMVIYSLNSSDRHARETAESATGHLVTLEREYWVEQSAHPAAKVRQESMNALQTWIGRPEIVSLFEKACQDSDPVVRLTAKAALAENDQKRILNWEDQLSDATRQELEELTDQLQQPVSRLSRKHRKRR